MNNNIHTRKFVSFELLVHYYFLISINIRLFYSNAISFRLSLFRVWERKNLPPLSPNEIYAAVSRALIYIIIKIWKKMHFNINYICQKRIDIIQINVHYSVLF